MAADPRLANLPALLKLAEEEARAHHAAWEDAVRLAGGTRFLIEETIATRAMLGDEEETAAHLALLADLTRPASRDAVARLVAAKWWPNAPPPTTAPHLYWTSEAHDSTDYDGAPNGDGWPEGWWLDSGDGNLHFFSWEDWCPDPDAHTMIVGLKGVTDPAEALTLIALHVLGSPDAHR